MRLSNRAQTEKFLYYLLEMIILVFLFLPQGKKIAGNEKGTKFHLQEVQDILDATLYSKDQ